MVKYRTGCKNQVPDALSRRITEEQRTEEEGDHLPFFGDKRVSVTTRYGANRADEREEEAEAMEEEDALDDARVDPELGIDAVVLQAPIIRE